MKCALRKTQEKGAGGEKEHDNTFLGNGASSVSEYVFLVLSCRKFTDGSFSLYLGCARGRWGADRMNDVVREGMKG